MSKATSKPDPYVVDRLARFTGMPKDVCAAALVEARYLWEPALTILRGEQGALKHIPVEEEPVTVYAPMVLTDGTQLQPGMTLEQIDNAVTYPRPTGNKTADRARRLAVKLGQEQRTAEQWQAFERAHVSTCVEVTQ